MSQTSRLSQMTFLPGLCRGAALVAALGATGGLSARAGAAQWAFRAEDLLTTDRLLRSPIRVESGGISGEIAQLLLDSRGAVRLVVIELLAPQRRTVTVPWSYLDVRADGSVWLQASERELLEAPEYEPGTTAALPPAGSGSASSASGAPTTFLTPPEREPRFQPGSVRSYRGVVVGTMVASRNASRGDEVTAIVEVQKRRLEARLGSESLHRELGLELEPGEEISFQGSPSDEDGTTVVMVSELRKDDRRFVLRERGAAFRQR